MNANPKFLAATAHVDEAAVAAAAELAQDLRRRLAPDSACRCARSRQSDTPASFGAEKNPPIFVYDTSGPVHRSGRARSTSARACRRCASRWIAERGDTEELPGPTSEYGRERAGRPEARRAALRPAAQAAPRAAPGAT